MNILTRFIVVVIARLILFISLLIAPSLFASEITMFNLTADNVVVRVKILPDEGNPATYLDPLVSLPSYGRVVIPVPDTSVGSWQIQTVVYSNPAYDVLQGDTFIGGVSASKDVLASWSGSMMSGYLITKVKTGLLLADAIEYFLYGFTLQVTLEFGGLIMRTIAMLRRPTGGEL